MTSAVHEPTVDQIFQANLSALRARQPGVAEQLSTIDVPTTAYYVIARDGEPTYRVEDEKGRRWLGRTSVPRARAKALVDDFTIETGNVLVTPIGGAAEARAVLERIGPHGAVLLYDSDLRDVRLALTLHDFSDDIEKSRLAFLIGENIETAIEAFFDDHPTYDFPQKLLAPPHIERAETETLRHAIERAAAQVNTSQTRRVSEIETRLRGKSFPRSPGVLAIVGVDPRQNAIETAHALSRATGDAIAVHVSVPNQPDQCHILARMRALAESDAALVINSGWGTLAGHVPDNMPSAAWLWPEARIVAGYTDGFSERQVVFGASKTACESAISCGAKPERTRLLEIGCGDVFDRTDPRSPTVDVVCLADIADLQYESIGIQLASQIAMWKAVCMQAATHLYAAPAEVLEAAERSCNVEIADETLRGHVLNLIESKVMPTMILRASVAALLDAGVDVRVYGRGWQHSRMPNDRVHEPPNDATERAAIYASTRAVLCPVYSSASVQTAMEATLAGAMVIFRRPNEPLSSAHPQLCDVLDKLPAMADLGEMRDHVLAALRGNREWETARAHAADSIRQRHTLRHRLDTILSALAVR